MSTKSNLALRQEGAAKMVGSIAEVRPLGWKNPSQEPGVRFYLPLPEYKVALWVWEPGKIPCEGSVQCRFLWSRHTSADDTIQGSVTYYKDYLLPFFPRAGDEFTLLNSVVAVNSSDYDPETKVTAVCINDFSLKEPNWLKISEEFQLGGWIFLEASGQAASRN